MPVDLDAIDHGAASGRERTVQRARRALPLDVADRPARVVPRIRHAKPPPLDLDDLESGPGRQSGERSGGGRRGRVAGGTQHHVDLWRDQGQTADLHPAEQQRQQFDASTNRANRDTDSTIVG